MIELKNITQKDMDICLSLSVASWQEKYAAPVADSLARAYVNPDHLIPLIIHLDEVPIGFLLFHLHPKTDNILLQEFLIDRHFQSKGYGTDALRKFVKYAEQIEPFQTLYTITAIGNTWAKHTLEYAGFMRGAVDIEERAIEMVYILR